MEREIPLYSYDGQLLQWIDAKRLDRLPSMDRVSRVVKHPKGRIARAFLRHMPVEPKPSFLPDYKGTKYCLRQRLGDGHRCFRLGREFLGLSAECGRDETVFVTNQPATRLQRLFEQHRREWGHRVLPTQPNDVDRLVGFAQRAFTRLKARRVRP